MKPSATVLLITAAVALGGCASNRGDLSKLSRINIEADIGCEREPSVHIYELRRGSRKNIDAPAPLQVAPGTYSVGVACLWVRSRQDNQCRNVRAEEAAAVIPYNLELKAGMLYTFSCSEKPTASAFVMSGAPIEVRGKAGETAESFNVDNRDFASSVPKPLEVTMKYDLRLKVTQR
jgi:hypothetical protein